MTRDEAIEWLERIEKKYIHGGDEFYDEARKEALHMAIEALEAVKRHEETFEWCTDCKEYDQENHCCHRWSKRIWESVEELKREWKRGEWIPVEDSDCWRGFLCSVCNKAVNQRENYCPNCGSYMRGDTDERIN